MDFSKGVFSATTAQPSLSEDTMDHANLVMACRFGWVADADDGVPSSTSHSSATHQTPSPAVHANTPISTNNKRFLNCRGRLYHQLTCSHRIRTDIVEDCGTNCLDPFEGKQDVPFYCHECLEQEVRSIWNARESEHNSLYPPLNQMTNEQYAQWFEEHRELEAQFSEDRQIHEMQLRATTRPSNVCSVMETTEAEMDFASQLDSLTLTMCPTNETTTSERAGSVSVPNDADEQLHWHLSSLALDDRGSCGVEYSANQTRNNPSSAPLTGKEELWRTSWKFN